MKGCLLFLGAVIGGLVIGLAVTAVLRAITHNDDLSFAIGTGFWLLCVPVILAYGTLWLGDLEDIAVPAKSTSIIQRRRHAKAESKLQTAELRMGFAFAMIGGATAAGIKSSNVFIAIVAICCAVFGGLVGFDIKRRVRQIRKQRAASNEFGDG